MKLRWLSLPCVLLAAACGSKSTTPTAPTAPTAPAGATVVLEGKGDLDGRAGDEPLTLYSDGTLIAGTWSAKVDATAGSEYVRGQQASLTVAVLDRAAGTRVVVVSLPTDEQEDPPNHYQVLMPRGGELVRIYDTTLGAYGVTALTFPGDGTVHYTQDAYTACAEAGGVKPIHDVALALDGSGVMVERSRTATGATADCDNLAACPWIYVDGAAGPVKVGEILRNVRGRAAYTLQDLALPAAAAGPLHVRVAEEENEVTFLDEIYVEADGLRVAPIACATEAPPAYCVADHQPLRMAQGDTLDLTFDLPRGATPTVFARGYYVPTPSRATR